MSLTSSMISNQGRLRYVNMDYLFFSTLQHSDEVLVLNVSYDIACQWSKHMLEQITNYLLCNNIPMHCAIISHSGSKSKCYIFPVLPYFKPTSLMLQILPLRSLLTLLNCECCLQLWRWAWLAMWTCVILSGSYTIPRHMMLFRSSGNTYNSNIILLGLRRTG